MSLCFEVQDSAELQGLVLEGGNLIVVFEADWCPLSNTIRINFTEQTKRYKGKLRVAFVNVDRQQEIASEYRVEGIPATFLFVGSLQVTRFCGYEAKTVARMFGQLDLK